jgi:hypothetical protein
MAVGAHGFVRATKGVDFAARVALPEVRRRLERAGFAAVLRRGDPREGEFPCVKATLEGVPVDVLPALVPLEWDQAIEVPLGKRSRLRVVDLDGLLRLKLRAGGPKDLLDVAALLLEHPQHRDRTVEAATAYGVSEDLQKWLEVRRRR